MKKIVSILLSIAAVALIASSVNAAGYGESNCQIVYGGGEVCQDQVKFTINKMVQKPNKGGEYVENLTSNDTKYQPNQNVNFKIVIENTGDRDIENLNVKDMFPEYLSFVAGVGNTNAGAREINFTIGKLAKGQKVEYVITAKTADSNKLPANQAITCTVNNVTATAKDGTQAQDNSQVCIEKNVLGATPTPQIYQKPTVKEVPATGPELFGLAALVPAGLAGFYLRRKTN